MAWARTLRQKCRMFVIDKKKKVLPSLWNKKSIFFTSRLLQIKKSYIKQLNTLNEGLSPYSIIVFSLLPSIMIYMPCSS